MLSCGRSRRLDSPWLAYAIRPRTFRGQNRNAESPRNHTSSRASASLPTVHPAASAASTNPTFASSVMRAHGANCPESDAVVATRYKLSSLLGSALARGVEESCGGIRPAGVRERAASCGDPPPCLPIAPARWATATWPDRTIPHGACRAFQCRLLGYPDAVSDVLWASSGHFTNLYSARFFRFYFSIS